MNSTKDRLIENSTHSYTCRRKLPLKKSEELIGNGHKCITLINTKLPMYATLVASVWLIDLRNVFRSCLDFCCIIKIKVTCFASDGFSQMKDIATENFQRICQAYEVLSDPNKRQIYDIYGMEGLTTGLELGSKLDKAEEIKAELERLRRLKEQEKIAAHFRTSGTILANMSLPHFLRGDGIMRGYCSVHNIFPLLLIGNHSSSSSIPLIMNSVNYHLNLENFSDLV